MKVGTDAVLLGAWAPLAQAKHILDIGTGCGILALMAAQRSRGRIDAIDPDAASVIEAAENFARSPWSERLQAKQAEVQEWSKEAYYDHILCNPPYFLHKLLSPSARRNLARHARQLTPKLLAFHIDRLLSPAGVFSMVCSAASFPVFLNEMEANHLYLIQMCQVKSNKHASPGLTLAAFGRYTPSRMVQNELVLMQADGKRSETYHHLTKGFYL
jgi:tRNA1Val (adenine37-N6)-methyltransferase